MLARLADMGEGAMSGTNRGFNFVFLPPQNEIWRGWAERLAREVPDAPVVVAEDMAHAEAARATAAGVYGTLPPGLLA